MAKKRFGMPSIIVALEPGTGDGSIVGDGTGTGIPSGDGDTTDYVTYEDWLILFEDQPEVLDYDGEGEIGSFDDYVKWMQDNGMGDLIEP